MVIFGRLIAQHQDNGYITYVFLNLDYKNKSDAKYYMCVRFPNWNADSIKLDDEGYIHFEERRAGIDEWFDGNNMIKYKYNTIQFMKFIPKPTESDKEIYLI